MKFFTKTSAAVIVAALGLGAVAPIALAQDQGQQAGPGFGPRHEQGMRAHNQDGMRQGGMRQDGERGGMRGGMLQLVCSEQGAERLEHMFVNISSRLDLTAEQTPLFDALKTAALSAQTGFADTCAAQLPAAGQTADLPNLVERVQTGIKMDEPRIAALSGVLPSLEAFYNSLTDDQKANLDAPGGMRREHFGERQGGPGMGDGSRHGGPGKGFGQHRPMMDQNG